MSSLRAAVGMFSVFPVGRVEVDARSGGHIVVWMPVVGVLISAASVLPALLVWHGAGHGSVLLAATVVVAGQALLTRGLHLDGLADLSDGLGSGHTADNALAIMRKSDIGPFGVAAVALALVIQISALASVLDLHRLPLALVAVGVVAVTARLAVVWAAGRGVPAARVDGFGSLVAASVGATARVAVTAAMLAGVVGAAALAGATGADLVWFAGAVLGGLAAARFVCHHAVRRLGGVTGDVFGAIVEVAATATTLVLAAQGAW